MQNSELISTILCAALAVAMIVIGVVQLKKTEPVPFPGQKSSSAAQFSDVTAWNTSHGLMWITYGLVVIFCCCLGVWLFSTGWSWVPIVLGLVIPPIVMIWYHSRLKEKYFH